MGQRGMSTAVFGDPEILQGRNSVSSYIADLEGVCNATVENFPIVRFNGRSRLFQVIFLGIVWAAPTGRLRAYRTELKDYFLLGMLLPPSVARERRILTETYARAETKAHLAIRPGEKDPSISKPGFDFPDTHDIP